MKNILSSILILAALCVGCKKEVVQPEAAPELELNNSKWECYSDVSKEIIFAIKFNADNTGEMWNGDAFITDRYDITWSTEKYGDGNYFLHVQYNKSDSVKQERGTCSYLGKRYTMLFKGYLCQKVL